ncbi:MAG TPA: hypothetical protein PKO06_20165, partial [Candidatus Ozemobacteraceae bacterium]|nr:hypothetical protein [Candidatus Ozemobacteraceae bacterium]
LVSFFGVGFFASLASQLWPWALSRATFDSVFGIAIGSVYFLLRWFLIFRLGPPLRPARRRKD